MASRGRGLVLSIKPDKASEEVTRMLKWNWKRRFQNLTAQIVYNSADTSLKAMKKKIPSKPENKEYLKSLGLARITGLSEGTVGYAIQGKSKQVSARSLKPDGTILYIRANRGPRRLPPEVAVLIRHSPWTLSSLPFSPKKSDATIVYRKVSLRAVEKVEKIRKADRRIWKQELNKTRISSKGPGSRLKVGGARIRAVSDLAFTALNMELGQGGVKAKPHWRTAISGFKKGGLRNMMKNRDMARAVSDPGFKNWMSWPKKTSKRISAKVAQTFVPFQKKLGIKTQK